METHDKVYDIIINKDDISWQSILMDLIRVEGMNPWDVDVSKIAFAYIETLKKLQSMDFRISGKVVLAAALLLKIKSERLVGEDIDNFDRLFAMANEQDFNVYDDFDEFEYSEGIREREDLSKFNLIPKTPQPRKRKVSIYDLVEALQKAMEVKKRRILREIPDIPMELPKRGVNITELIKNIYEKIVEFYKKENKKLLFSDLCVSDKKEDKVYTFMPLLHLSNQDQRKIDLEQEKNFGDIEIKIVKKDAKVAQ